jgi:hypothetical protein
MCCKLKPLGELTALGAPYVELLFAGNFFFVLTNGICALDLRSVHNVHVADEFGGAFPSSHV